MEKDKKSGSINQNKLFSPPFLIAIIAILFVAVVVLGALLIRSQQQDSSVVATVNGEVLTRDDLYAVMYEMVGSDALEELITKRLLFQEAERLGITVSEEEVAAELQVVIDQDFQGSEEVFKNVLEYHGITYENYRERVHFSILLRAVALSIIDYSADDTFKFYEENRHLFMLPDEVEANHILVETEQEAQYIVTLLEDGADFAELARQYSLDLGNKDQGGYLGYFGRGVMVEEFEDTVFSLQVGEISDPVQTDFGYHIIQLLDFREAGEARYEDVRADIEDVLVGEKMQEAITELLWKLYEEADIEYQS